MIRHVQLRELEPWSYVAFIGEFNNWSTTATPLEFGDGVWQAFVDLPPGEHRYAFFVMGYDEFGQPWSDIIPGTDQLSLAESEREVMSAH